ncbi:MAG: efflux RND transporter periplasmic adaptor subunit, partial [Rhizobiaceae bacterium]|nr:efflux RND transporter periplasmic adaptor subunit [Rhizobiaceae bacterium]
LEQSEAEADAALADLDNAKLQLDYTTIRSPIDGKVGFRQIDVGNMIRIGDRTTIAVVTQVQPVNVVFTLPQEDLLDIVGQLGPGKSLPVAAMARDGKLDLGSGTLSTIDNQVDPNTGTFKLKAVFANDSKTLWPGEFVSVKLLVQNAERVVVVPAPAVQRGPEGAYVYVVTADGKAEMRPVEVSLIQDGLAVIGSGVTEGDRVVVDGQFKLAPGSRVTIADGAQDSSEAQAAPAEAGN